jgi:lipoate-protein ligase A
VNDQLSTCRLLVDGPASGAVNMAVDEVLLASAIERECLTVRVYQWHEPTVSLGHFQSPSDPVLSERFGALSRVRRLSGGGAILHDREVTYSCAVPRSHPMALNPVRIYDAVHKAIISLLQRHGITAGMRGEAKQAPEPFLCFGRGDPRDIVIGADKIVGSAQRRRSGAILQHGAILLAASRHAPEFPGIAELTGVHLNPESLSTELGTALQAALCPGSVTTRNHDALLPEEAALAQEWSASRYSIAIAAPGEPGT